MKKFFILILVFCSLSSVKAQKTVDYSFVVVGCNRVDDADTAGNMPSTANVYHLSRTFREVADLNPLPRYFFFAGDLVIGYTADTSSLASQLEGWKQLYYNSPLKKTNVQLIAIPGNHETQNKAAGKKSYPAAERTWLRIMKEFIAGSNGPHAGEEDSLLTDQNKLTYSINYKNDHFVLIDTDPVGSDWKVPYRWIRKDIDSARANGARHIFAIGHKPAYPALSSGTDGLALYPAQRDSFWTAMENNKAEAMFSAHNHLWEKQQPHPGKTWQIIAGNGGSRLEKTITNTLHTERSYFGYTLVTVYTDGTADVKSMGRQVDMNPAKAEYTKAIDDIPTTVRDSFDISWNESVVTTITPEGNVILTREDIKIVPNPSDRNVTISFSIPEVAIGKVSLYNTEGKFIRNIADGKLQAGLNQFTFDTEKLKEGTYFIKLMSNTFNASEKLIIVH